jgi:hypothetical protein
MSSISAGFKLKNYIILLFTNIFFMVVLVLTFFKSGFSFIFPGAEKNFIFGFLIEIIFLILFHNFLNEFY